MSETLKSLSRRSKALLSILAISIVIGVLIYLEQIAVLYGLATLALIALLLVVAFADLENIEIAE